jgi:hypothetical protein
VANTIPVLWDTTGSIPTSQKWEPYFTTADNHTILPNVQLSGPTNQGTTGTCPSNTYDVYLSLCDLNDAIAETDNTTPTTTYRALKMSGPTGCAPFSIAANAAFISNLTTCNNLICWVVDRANTYTKPIVVHIMCGETNLGQSVRFSWSASSQFLQNQTILDPFVTDPTPPLWIDAVGRTGTIGFYAGQTGVTGGRILLAGANNTL